VRTSASSAKSAMRLLLLVGVVAAAITVGASTAGASTGSTPLAVVPVTGTTSDGGTFTGTMSVDSVTLQNGVPVAAGTISGAVTNAAGQTIGTVDAAPFAAPAQPQQADASCTLFSFSIGPIDLNVAGLVTVHIDPIGASVTLNGLLGTLLCGILGGGGGTPAVAA
jgi:hypothetical protein